MNDDQIRMLLATVILLAGAVAFSLWATWAESKTYNRLCGGHATWRDAIVSDLRVDGNCAAKEAAGE